MALAAAAAARARRLRASRSGSAIWFARGLGLIGVCASSWRCSSSFREQTITEKPSDDITVTTVPVFRTDAGLARRGDDRSAVRGRWRSCGRVSSKARYQLPQQGSAPSQGGTQASSPGRNTRPPCASIIRPSRPRRTGRGLLPARLRLSGDGQNEQALTDFDRAIERDPRFAAAYLERGRIRTESGDFDAALADFGQLMMIRANDPETYLHRGICLVKKGLFDDAAADFHRVLKLTNHSDFAEPAKNYLRAAREPGRSAAASQRQRRAGFPSSPQPRAQDHAI